MTDQPRSDLGPIPPRPLPLQGRSCPFGRYVREHRSWLDLLRESAYSMKLGRFRIWPFTTLYLINDPAEVRRVMHDRATFPKDHRVWRLLRPLIGDSIINSDGPTWERQRRMIDPAFAQARLRIVFPLMREAVADMLARVESSAASGEFDVDAETTHVTADVILRTVLSLPISGGDAQRIYDAFLAFTATLRNQGLWSLARLPEWAGAAFRSREGRKQANIIRTLLADRIRPRFEAHRSGAPGPQQDILTGLLEARDEQGDGSGFPFEELVDHVAMLFMAGHETSASALAWAIHLLATHPEAQERVFAEVSREIGERQIEHGDIKRLPFTLDVFRETLRLYPPVGFLPRESAVPATLRGQAVAAGCPVLVAPWVMQRHRKLWREPDAFDPDRFRREEDAAAIAGAYLPFGMGPRVCLGAAMAIQEGVLVLASLVRAYRFTPLADYPAAPYAKLTIRSEHPIRVGLAHR